MLRAFLASFTLSLTVLLAACGGDSGSAMGGSPGASSTVNSNVVKGIIRNGVVKARRWQDGAYVDVASAYTGESGQYSLSLPHTVPGEVLRLDLEISTDPARPTAMRCDADHCDSASFGEWVAMTEAPGLTSWVSVGDDGSLTVMPMTPVSALLVRYAEDLGGGHLTAAALDFARSRVAAVLGLDASTLLTTPGDIASAPWVAAASPEALRISLLAAGFAQLATDNGETVATVLDNYASEFVAENGRLMQSGAYVSLANLFTSVGKVIVWSGADGLETWTNNILGALQDGVLSALPATTGGDFDPATFVNALGTMTDSLGGDIRRVIAASSVTSLQELIASELAQFGWLASADSLAVALVAVDVVKYSVLGCVALDMPGMEFPAAAPGGLTLTLDRSAKTLQFTGTENGLDTSLTISLTPFSTGAAAHLFTFGAAGTVGNSRVHGSIDGTLRIDTKDTDVMGAVTALAGLLSASADSPLSDSTKAALVNFLQTAHGLFTVEGAASLQSLVQSGSQLAVSGLASLEVDMNGGSAGAITGAVAVDHGSLTLPNGDQFVIDKEDGDFLTGTMSTDGALSTEFSAYALTLPKTEVVVQGQLKAMGTLLTAARDTLVTEVQNDTLSLDNLLAGLLNLDYSQLRLLVDGTVHITGDIDHLYHFSFADRTLQISQPNSDDIALAVTLGLHGLFAQAGGQWWLLGITFPSDLLHPVVTIADSSGGEWPFYFDFSGLLTAT